VEGIMTVDNAPSGRSFGPEAAGSLLTLARLVGVAMARVRVSAELETRALEAEMLATAGARLASVLEPARVHELVLEQISKLVPLDHVVMLICDGAWARFVAGLGADQLHPGTPVIDLEGACGAALTGANGHALRIADVAVSPVWHDFPLWAGEHRIRSLMIAPLMHDDAMLACLCISSFNLGAFSERRAMVATTFAERAAQALLNARMYRAAVDGAAGTPPAVRQPSAEHSHAPAAPLPPSAIDFDEDAHLELDDGTEPIYVGRQEQVVENLRLLSQLDSDNLPLAPQAVAVRTLVERAIRSASEGVRDRAISLRGPDDLHAVVDSERAVEILGNLLDNAARYSRSSRPITVAWSIEDGGAAIRVQDHGHGIAAQNRRFLFTRFGWLPGTAANRSPKGIGLGLYLGRSIAEAMGGSLDLEASSPRGSLFRLKLPLPPD
jgi:Histidine kinase-, DNA gyrase B-, and HSP90-like ATPase/GAF domain